MSLPDVVTREQWLEARRQLLAQEKALPRRHDALNAQVSAMAASGTDAAESPAED